MMPKSLTSILLVSLCPLHAAAEFVVVRNGKPAAEVVVDRTNARAGNTAVLEDAGKWLVESLEKASGATLPVKNELGETPAIVIARADAHPKVSAASKLDKLDASNYEAYSLVTRPGRLYILGRSEAGARHGVAHLLRHLGFRYFAPSPRWHVVPKMKSITLDLNVVERPKLTDRRIWYAYAGGEKRLMEDYNRWAVANRLSVRSRVRTGHSYGNIIGRNREAFDKHPEYYALLPDGKRDNTAAVAARKFCFSNEDLIRLVIADRIRLLEEYRKQDPDAYMVSVDPSDGQGTCRCENCRKLGTTTDRVFHLANRVARGLREKHAGAWVGLYAYSSHRLPPTIDVEPNVYVQVAMGFNRTQYTLPELVDRWSRKVGSIGLREYYGVEAWDWGLPGRMRGGREAYHRKWIPFYAQRKLNAINAETNANWGGQMLGLYVAAQMTWDPAADVDALRDEFFSLAFGKAAKPMRELFAKFDQAPPLRSATLLPLFRNLQRAERLAASDAVKQRLVDVKAYLVYVSKFRQFDLVRNRSSERGDEYYKALRPLMEYAWRIRFRDMVHCYALARRLCNGLPVRDKRLDFYMFNKVKPPVWMQGAPLSDGEIAGLFAEQIKRLAADDDPVVAFSRYFEPAKAPADDAGPSRILSKKEAGTSGIARFRNGLRAYLIASGDQTVRLEMAPTGREVTFTVYHRDAVLMEKSLRPPRDAKPPADGKKPSEPTLQEVVIELPRAGGYRLNITGGLRLRVPEKTPFVFEASVTRPAWIDYSGPHYFYVPRGTKELIVDANPRLSLTVPGRKKRLDVHPADRAVGRDYISIPVPAGASGRIWHTTANTRGRVALLNIPPLLSFHPDTLFIPREVAEADGLTTKR